MVPHVNGLALVAGIRKRVPILTGTLYPCRSTGDGLLNVAWHPGSHNVKCIHCWLQDSVAAQQKLLDKTHRIFEARYSTFRLMITCAVCRYCFMLYIPSLMLVARILLPRIVPFGLPSFAFLEFPWRHRKIIRFTSICSFGHQYDNL
jgi:hypothetical protein